MNKDACQKCCFIKSKLKNKLRKELTVVEGKCAYCDKIYVAKRVNDEKGNYMRIEITEKE